MKKAIIPLVLLPFLGISIIPIILIDNQINNKEIRDSIFENSIQEKYHSTTRKTEATVLTRDIANELGWITTTHITLDDWFTMAPNVTSIAENSFWASNLISIEIPASIQYIGNQSFHTGYLNSATFELGSLLHTIDDLAFSGFITETFIVPKKVERLGESSFRGGQVKQLLFESESELIEIGSLAFENNMIESIKIPESTKIIGQDAFKNTKNLVDISIPISFKDMGMEYFGFTQEQWNIINWFHPSKTDATLLTRDIIGQIGWSEKATITLEDWNKYAPNVVDIEPGIWQQNLFIKSITIPNNIKTLSSDLFESSTLESLYFTEDSQLHTISDRVFQGSEIKKIEIPLSVEVIQENAFASTSMLGDISMDYKFQESYKFFGFSDAQYENIRWINQQITPIIPPISDEKNSTSLIIIGALLASMIPISVIVVYVVKKIKK